MSLTSRLEPRSNHRCAAGIVADVGSCGIAACPLNMLYNAAGGRGVAFTASVDAFAGLGATVAHPVDGLLTGRFQCTAMLSGILINLCGCISTCLLPSEAELGC